MSLPSNVTYWRCGPAPDTRSKGSRSSPRLILPVHGIEQLLQFFAPLGVDVGHMGDPARQVGAEIRVRAPVLAFTAVTHTIVKSGF